MEPKDTEHILDSLEDLQKASPGAFFYTRVQARLQKEETGIWGNLAGYITRPAVALVTLGLIFLLNAAAFFYEREASSVTADQNEQTISEEYNTTLAANSYYDENNDAR
jgi:hypothetical protein